ncbi:hypothetical protein QBC42DRAFT_344644 [Cladorrhinum samala]|uniref:Uncharacterized protein n=1 Tax=Cladorrhinum samala TaxID=585594 RepID=A0AAV9HXY6_9PEZI|nr:hypothetical protein QBC42DRAFT_344644 [Cladorrhinum samala]
MRRSEAREMVEERREEGSCCRAVEPVVKDVAPRKRLVGTQLSLINDPWLDHKNSNRDKCHVSVVLLVPGVGFALMVVLGWRLHEPEALPGGWILDSIAQMLQEADHW